MRNAYLLALPLTCLLAGNAFGQACTKPLTLKSEIQMESMGGGPASIPVKINGTDQKLTFATAGTTTQLTEDFAKSLNLEIKQASGVLLQNEMGMTSNHEVTIAEFSMPGLRGTNLKWPISIGGGFGGRGSSGQFSLNYMLPYDIDVDFGSDKLRFFLQDHCPGAVMYWKAPGAVGVAPISIVRGRVTVPVKVDGKDIRAVIDTSARGSSIYAAIAEKVLGVDVTTAKSLDAKSVTIGPLALSNISFTVRPDINSQEARDTAQGMRARKAGIDFEMANPEVVLGMDVLRKLHLYMAFGENKLYVTETANTLPVTAAAPAAGRGPQP